MRFTSIALIGFLGLTSTTLAQSSGSTTATPSSSASPSSTASSSTSSSSLIPTGISSDCSTYLLSLNTDPTLQACTAPLLSATQYYANATKAAASGDKAGSSANVTDSATALQNTLGQLCSGSTGCQPSTIRSQLSKFWNACQADLKSKNQAVNQLYDVLYLINPFHDAVCTKDDSNNYCIMSIANSTVSSETSPTSKRSLLTEDEQLLPLEERSLLARQNAESAAQSIDSGSGSDSNIAYLFLQPTSEKNVLCSSCSANIMAAYISFETSIPYAIGLQNSQQLSGQSALYKAMENTCGRSFTTEINTKAGTTAFAEVGGARDSLNLSKTKLIFAFGSATVLAGLLLA